MSAKELVNSIIEAHGGLERYSKTSSVDVEFNFTGALLGLKGRHTHIAPRVSVSTREQKVTYHGLGGPAGEAWVFTPARTYKQNSKGEIIDSRENPLQAFAGHKMETPWDDFHFIYFAGYALWQYINFPYILARPDFEVEEVAPHEEFGETFRVLKVTFPEQSKFASHNKIQKFYFNERFELVRHDYAPEVLAGADAAHYTVDNVSVGGLKYPTMRRVVAKGPNGPMYNGPIPTLINLVFRRIELKDEGGSTSEGDVWALTDAPAP